MSDFAPVEVAPRDCSLLEKIGRLRVLAWSTVMPDVAERTNCWLDEFELVARHWCVFHDGEPVAAARLSVHQRVEDVPDAEIYAAVLSEPLLVPIASFNRLVTHPLFRNKGLSRSLDEIRIQTAWEMGCACVLGATPSGPERLAAMAALGFEPRGVPVDEPVGGFFTGLKAQVIVLMR